MGSELGWTHAAVNRFAASGWRRAGSPLPWVFERLACPVARRVRACCVVQCRLLRVGVVLRATAFCQGRALVFGARLAPAYLGAGVLRGSSLVALRGSRAFSSESTSNFKSGELACAARAATRQSYVTRPCSTLQRQPCRLSASSGLAGRHLAARRRRQR